MTVISRETLLALTPDVYLRSGFREDGRIRARLTGDYATAAAVQLEEAEVAPQELSFLFEAIKQALPLHHGDAAPRLRGALQEAYETAREIIGQTNNPGLVKWVDACAAHVVSTTDVDDFIIHLQATLRQHAVFHALRHAPSKA